MLEVTGMSKILEQVVDQLLNNMKVSHPDLPPEFAETFRKKVKVDDLINLIRPVYAKYYTAEDLRAISAFYQSPTGKKMLTNMPKLMAEVSEIGRAWGEKMGREAFQEIQDKKGK